MVNLLTHVPEKERISFDEIAHKLNSIQQSLKNSPTLSISEKQRLSNEAEQLSQTEFGRFLIANNGGLSGWWTYYCILGYKQIEITNPVEKFLLEEAPIIQATRERFAHFQQVMQALIDKHNFENTSMTLASVPGGMAADLLTLQPNINFKHNELRFVNIDLDEAVLARSQELSKSLQPSVYLDCRHEDAWTIKAREEFDVVTSNGLNIYVPQREKVVALYAHLLKTLKSGGTLITSVITPPLSHPDCELNKEQLNVAALTRQVGIFSHILQATWANFSTTREMIARLTEAGFKEIRIIPDRKNMFPTFVAKKT